MGHNYTDRKVLVPYFLQPKSQATNLSNPDTDRFGAVFWRFFSARLNKLPFLIQ